MTGESGVPASLVRHYSDLLHCGRSEAVLAMEDCRQRAITFTKPTAQKVSLLDHINNHWLVQTILGILAQSLFYSKIWGAIKNQGTGWGGLWGGVVVPPSSSLRDYGAS